MLGWLRLGDLLDLPALAQGELQRVATQLGRAKVTCYGTSLERPCWREMIVVWQGRLSS